MNYGWKDMRYLGLYSRAIHSHPPSLTKSRKMWRPPLDYNILFEKVKKENIQTIIGKMIDIDSIMKKTSILTVIWPLERVSNICQFKYLMMIPNPTA